MVPATRPKRQQSLLLVQLFPTCSNYALCRFEQFKVEVSA
jgi:hypothetical protein